MKKLIFNFRQFKPTQKVAFGLSVLTKMDGNLNFPTPNPTLAALKEVQDSFGISVTNAEKGSKQDLLMRQEKEAKWDAAFTQLANYITSLADGDVAKMLSSGFEVNRDRKPLGIPEAPQNLRIRTANLTGAVEVQWKRSYGAASYILYMAKTAPTAAPTDADFRQVDVITRGKAAVTDLERGSMYYFRIQAVGSAGDSTLSASISSICP